jgi:hypothetical protein
MAPSLPSIGMMTIEAPSVSRQIAIRDPCLERGKHIRHGSDQRGDGLGVASSGEGGSTTSPAKRKECKWPNLYPCRSTP